MRSRLPRHTYGFIQRELCPYYFHIGSTCAFLNLTLFAMYHPSELLSEEETTQVVASCFKRPAGCSPKPCPCGGPLHSALLGLLWGR